jgi:hypothetical protein
MTTFAELFSSLKDELKARYRSPIWGVALLSIAAIHWKIVVFFLTEKPRASEAIEFVQTNASLISLLGAFAFSVVYVVVFPWIELLIEQATSRGKRARNEFQYRELEAASARRKLIAQQEQESLDLELKNILKQSQLADIDRVKNYQRVLSGENFNRWLKDIERGAVNSFLGNSIVEYLNKVDAVEGTFVDTSIEAAHKKFVGAISTLSSALSTSPQDKSDLVVHSRNALSAHQDYRAEVRTKLGV